MSERLTYERLVALSVGANRIGTEALTLKERKWLAYY